MVTEESTLCQVRVAGFVGRDLTLGFGDAVFLLLHSCPRAASNLSIAPRDPALFPLRASLRLICLSYLRVQLNFHQFVDRPSKLMSQLVAEPAPLTSCSAFVRLETREVSVAQLQGSISSGPNWLLGH